MVNDSKIRVRVAPSPTGYLHVGTAQSALYNWLFARKNGGKFLLRIEDTDKERSTKEFEQSIYDALEWLDLKPDEPPVIQSANLSRHKEMLEKLLAEGRAFYCHHTKEELEDERKKQEENKQAPRHVCSDKRLTTNDQRQEKTKGIIRLAVDENSDRVISFDDQVRGKIEFKQSLLGDFAIARTVDDPLYHFAVVVDDIDMEISHVIRGEDHISNTPKQILIYEALRQIRQAHCGEEFETQAQGKLLEIPQFGHLPLILAPDRSKLSKRHGDTAVLSYKKDYLPEAMVNFLGGLSYTFSKEIISKEEMVEEFELNKVHKAGAIFDVKKLNWINSSYVKSLNVDKFKSLVGLKELSDKVVPIITERLEKLSDVHNFDYFWEEPQYDKNLLKWKKATLEESISALKKVHDILEKIEFTRENLLKVLDELGQNLGDRGLAYWPLRVALTGKEKSPDPIDIALVLGKQETLKRIKNAF